MAFWDSFTLGKLDFDTAFTVYFSLYMSLEDLIVIYSRLLLYNSYELILLHPAIIFTKVQLLPEHRKCPQKCVRHFQYTFTENSFLGGNSDYFVE